MFSASRASSFREDRAALAFAEAIVPGSATIPAADETTVARVKEVVGKLHPRFVRALSVAEKALNLAAVAREGRPFHALSAIRQDALVRSWERDPVMRSPLSLLSLVYKFVHFDQPRVYEALGGKRETVSALEQPRWLCQISSGNDLPDGTVLECDVVVIGTGAGGAVVGRELADRGHAVVFVEEGEHHRRDAFEGSSVRAHERFYRGAFSVGNVAMPIFMGRIVGGSTAINGGTCFRTPSAILEQWCRDLGTEEFSPGRMRRHFERVEAVLQVAPSKQEHIGPIADVMARGCAALGWSHSRLLRNAPECDGSGFCDFGCRTDARRSTQIAYLPPALERGAVLATGLRATRLLVEQGRAAGVIAVAKNGHTTRVRAGTVVFAGGAIPSPLFLLAQDLCNGSGQVGRNLSVHPSCGFSARFDEGIYGHRHIPQGYGCDQFVSEGFAILAGQPDMNVAPLMFPFAGRRLMRALDGIERVASFALMIRDATPNGRVWRSVGGLPAITYNITQADVRLMHQAMIRTGEMCLAAGAKSFFPGTLRTPVLEDERAFDRFRREKLAAKDFVWVSYHPLGTCKMGVDAKTSVVGLDHQTHELPGLYIVDGSTVPGPPGVNPQVTIMAMATRAAECIAERL
jgi:choline dehydrogenase-like flavoprotein